jgi:hypothetical protein
MMIPSAGAVLDNNLDDNQRNPVWGRRMVDLI